MLFQKSYAPVKPMWFWLWLRSGGRTAHYLVGPITTANAFIKQITTVTFVVRGSYFSICTVSVSGAVFQSHPSTVATRTKRHSIRRDAIAPHGIVMVAILHGFIKQGTGWTIDLFGIIGSIAAVSVCRTVIQSHPSSVTARAR